MGGSLGLRQRRGEEAVAKAEAVAAAKGVDARKSSSPHPRRRTMPRTRLWIHLRARRGKKVAEQTDAEAVQKPKKARNQKDDMGKSSNTSSKEAKGKKEGKQGKNPPKEPEQKAERPAKKPRAEPEHGPTLAQRAELKKCFSYSRITFPLRI